MGSKERREREREQRKSHILNTARELLLGKGLSATSINQIAKRSELSVGAIYFYPESVARIMRIGPCSQNWPLPIDF